MNIDQTAITALQPSTEAVVDESALIRAVAPNDADILKDLFSDTFIQHVSTSEIYHAIAHQGSGTYKSAYDNASANVTVNDAFSCFPTQLVFFVVAAGLDQGSAWLL